MSDKPIKAEIVRTHEQKIALNQIGRKFLLAFFSALRTCKFHKPENAIFNEPIEALNETTAKVITQESQIDCRLIEDQFFLNGLWIKPTLSEKENLFMLADYLKSAGLGGVTIRAKTSDADWRTFLRVYRETHAPAEKKVEVLNREIAAAKIEHFEVQRILILREKDEEALPFPPVVYAGVKAYSRALLVLREFTLSPTGEEQVEVLRKAQRIVCELVEMAEKTPRLVGIFSLLKNFDSYFYHHGVNVCVLSLLLGKEAGLGRQELVDLGLAALLHDAGKLLIPEEVLSKEGELNDEEWKLIRHHPIDSARIFLTLGYLNESVSERVLVAYQHHWASGSKQSYPQPRRIMNPTLMSSIVSLCVAYDAFTTNKTYRGAFAPHQTVRILAAQVEQGHYRKDLARLFLKTLGAAPLGSWLKLETGEIGMVAAGGNFAPTPRFPLLFVPEGHGKGRWIDTAMEIPALGRRPKLAFGLKGPLDAQSAIGAMLANGERFLF